jgi:cytochrome c oxidase subunit 3
MAEHSSTVAHQFDDAAQQREASTLGMWTFLATEVLFFGAVLTAYGVYRLRFPAEFRHGSMELKWYLGGINTAVLLLSSFFMALAVHAAQLGHNKQLIRNLWVTVVLGAAFLAIKGTEYYLEYEEGLLPGPISFRDSPPSEAHENGFVRAFSRFERWLEPATKEAIEKTPRPREERLFMTFYFVLTGIHATHMVVGLGVLLTMIWMTRRGWFSAGYHNPIEIAGLYWHFVDTAWVFLFPILYLLRNP